MNPRKPELDKIRISLMDRILLAGVILLIVITLGVFHLYTFRAQQNQISFVQLTMEKIATNQKAQFESFIDEKIHILQALVSYPQLYEMNSEQQATFIRNRSETFGFHHIFVMDTEGIGYYIEEDVRRDQRNEDFFHHIMEHDIYITEPFYTFEGNAITTICVSIYNQGEKVGVLCGALNLSTLQQLIVRNETPLQGDSFILDSSGYYVTPAKGIAIKEGASIYDIKGCEVSLIQQAFLYKEDESGSIHLDGKEYLAQVSYLPDYNWAIVQCIPMSRVVAQFQNMSVLQYIISGSVLVLTFCISRLIYCWTKSDRETYTDALTQCNNRAACNKMLAYLQSKTSDDITIMFMDLNKFKFVNDTYGHDKGDELLILFSQSLKEIFDKVGFVARVGGDEFVIILLNTSQDRITELWSSLTTLLCERSKGLDFPYVIASSYGFATRKKGEAGDLFLLMQQADEKMYAQKHGKTTI